MSTIIKLQPLSGAQSNSLTCCFLLQLDDFRILLDCGWNELLSMEIIEEYKKHLRSIDAVIISYPDIWHLGALPYLFGKCGLSCPVFATVPVHNMGLMFMYDLCQSRLSMGHMNDPFSLDDVDASFESIIQLKYCQSVKPNSRHSDLVITPLPGGHMIGGTMWRIVKDSEEHIIYAIDFNHKPERHLNMCSFEGESKASAALAGASRRRPVLMITDAAKPQHNRRRARDEQLVKTIADALTTEKECLICTDSGGRVLELLIMLDQVWPSIQSNNGQCSLVYISHVSYNVVEFARSMVEWMSDQLTTDFEQSRTNPFRLCNFKICQTKEQLDRIQGPKVILTSSNDLENGFARNLFLEMCKLEKCIIMLTICPSKGTLGRELIDSMVMNNNGILQSTMEFICVNISSRVKLEGEDLRTALEKFETVQLEAVDSVTGVTSKEINDDRLEDIIDVPQIINIKHDIKPCDILYSARLDFMNITKSPYPMYPFKEQRHKSDEYGELLTEQWINEEKETASTSRITKETYGHKSSDILDYEDNVLYRQVIEKNKTINIKSEVIFIDFEGRSDTDSVRRIVREQRPRNLIIVHGTEESATHLTELCKDFGGPTFCPAVGEVIDVTQEKNMLQVYLDGQFAQQLKFSRTKDHDLAWVNGIVVSEENKLIKEGNKNVQRRMIIKPIAANDNKIPDRRHVVFVNDPKLSDLKVSLCDQGIRAEFLGGTLMCDNVVAVKRNESGKIVLEGTLCDTFFKVRSILYSFYAII